ncbi:MAG TPA: hypothetical protein VJS45_18825 [Acidimicrobiia bacterium]|nr:hypothetical protein [Acidimicrobiia bacterium]
MRTTTRIRAMAMLAAAGLALPVAACGEEGVTKTEYLAKAKAVCQKGNQALTDASNATFAKVPPGQKLSDPEIESFVRQTVIPTIREQVKELRALPPPKGKKSNVEEIYRALDKGLDELETNPKKLIDGSNVFAEADSLAAKYGITVCATTP